MVLTRGVTLKSVTLALILIPINCYWIMYTEMVWWGLFPTTMSLFFNAVFFLFIITLFNLLLRRVKQQWALTHGELLVIYVMLCMASAIASHDHAQVLIPMIGHVFWFDTPENEWRELLYRYMPTWGTVQDKRILEGFYEGQSTVYDTEVLTGVVRADIVVDKFYFSCLSLLCSASTLCYANSGQNARNSPIRSSKLPLEMTRDSGANFFRGRVFWTAFILVSLLNLVNGLSYLFPTIPIIGVRFRNISQFFNENRGMLSDGHPFLSIRLSLDSDSSCHWICPFPVGSFICYRKMQRVGGAIIGVPRATGIPL